LYQTKEESWVIAAGAGILHSSEPGAGAGPVERAEDWPWSSVRDYGGDLSALAGAHPILRIDRILLPAEARTRI